MSDFQVFHLTPNTTITQSNRFHTLDDVLSRPLIKNSSVVLMEQVHSNIVTKIESETSGLTVLQTDAITNDVPYKVFQLEVALETLQSRDKIREGVEQGCRKPLGDKEIALIYFRIKENPYSNAIRLDTEKLSVEEAMELIDRQFKK